MRKPLVTILGKTVKGVASLRGGGSALPGLVVEHIDPDFISYTLSKLPLGVIVVSGTNGKTTTTKMVVELLRSQGLKVFTNRTGSNFARGVAAALLGEVDFKGRLNADIAVLELDEAHAVNFVSKIPPKYSLILNVMRDQLDRFGEIDHTAKLLERVAIATTDGVILNREDRRVSKISEKIKGKKVGFFGLDTNLIDIFPNDDDLHSHVSADLNQREADVVLRKFSGQKAAFLIDDQEITMKLKLNGIYNVFNAAAALALVRMILGKKLNQDKAIKALSSVTPAFGRGELLIVNDQPLELVLVKNPSGFQLGLKSFDPSKYVTMIAINDNYADGRDMSWLWDVDFRSLAENGVYQVSGIRAYDMALRLQYDEIAFKNVEPNLKKALNKFIEKNSKRPKRIFCTYTAMLAIRKELSKITDMEDVR